MLDSSRLFFALWPDSETRIKLAQLSRTIEAKAINLVRPDNYHVTLVFIGRVNKASELLIKQRVVDIASEPFTITFGHLSYWNKPKVLCLTSQYPVQQAMLLAEKLNSAVVSCAISTDNKPYNPHVTLARHIPAFDEQDCEPIVWKADSFCLVESCSGVDGVIYQVKQQWPFAKS
jgi:RNA 2',3'-cyclic 3'-phosphodiesterase